MRIRRRRKLFTKERTRWTLVLLLVVLIAAGLWIVTNGDARKMPGATQQHAMNEFYDIAEPCAPKARVDEGASPK